MFITHGHSLLKEKYSIIYFYLLENTYSLKYLHFQIICSYRTESTLEAWILRTYWEKYEGI